VDLGSQAIVVGSQEEAVVGIAGKLAVGNREGLGVPMAEGIVVGNWEEAAEEIAEKLAVSSQEGLVAGSQEGLAVGSQEEVVVGSREEAAVNTEVQVAESSQVGIVGTRSERYQIDPAEIRCFVPMSVFLRKADCSSS